MHSHPYRHIFALGLWGSYKEHRIAGAPFTRRAPYFYTMDSGHVHHVQDVTPGHTSVFVGLARAKDSTPGDKRYYGVPRESFLLNPPAPLTRFTTWQAHIKQKVARI
jgi:hypothetical protein